MKASTRRVWGLVYRHLTLYRRSWPRLVEIAYWPTLQLLIWGFTATFFSHAHGSPAAMAGGALIAGVLLWEITLRGQLGVTITFLEDIWSRNLGHVFVSPLRPAELIASLLTVSFFRTLVGLLPALLIAYLLYDYNILLLGPVLIFFFINLMIMGWWVALGIVSLLFRYGAGAESLAWTIAFGITPFACVFYPLSALRFGYNPSHSRYRPNIFLPECGRLCSITGRHGASWQSPACSTPSGQYARPGFLPDSFGRQESVAR